MIPTNLFAVVLLCAALASFLPSLKSSRFIRAVILIIALFYFTLTILPLGEWALTPLENRYAQTKLPEDIDGIVVLTSDEDPETTGYRTQPVLKNSAQRYLYLIRLAERYPGKPIIITGNTWAKRMAHDVATKDVILAALQGSGINTEVIRFEEKSRNTRENALFTKELVNPKEGSNWLLVTSAFHMPRSILCFEGVGWQVKPTPSDYFTKGNYPLKIIMNLSEQARYLSLAMHEYYGLATYWTHGWIKRPWA
jgi:uncharacterized SAM-binding protein YcdF (DUF218 family)